MLTNKKTTVDLTVRSFPKVLLKQLTRVAKAHGISCHASDVIRWASAQTLLREQAGAGAGAPAETAGSEPAGS